MKTELNDRELNIVHHVLDELLMKPIDELNRTFGSLTIEEMKKLYGKLHLREYCESHDIRYEDMTEDDKYNAAEWYNDKAEEEAYAMMAECDERG